MSNLLISGNTLEGWDLNEILSEAIISSKSRDIERMEQYHWENKIGPYCQGMTYYEIEQLERSAMMEDYSYGL